MKEETFALLRCANLLKQGAKEEGKRQSRKLRLIQCAILVRAGFNPLTEEPLPSGEEGEIIKSAFTYNSNQLELFNVV